MNIKGFKRMLFGEKMPDKDDPQYKERYEREVQAGHKFAKATRIDQAAAKVQGFANAHRTLFLVIVFTFVIGAFAWKRLPLGNCVQAQSGKSHGNGNAGFCTSGTAQIVAGSRNKGT
mgnify:CR=1 FL=1